MSLVDLCRRLAMPLEPILTEQEPKVEPLEGIRAVLFDVYGTLLVSASGDISLATGGGRGDAMADALAEVGVHFTGSGDAAVDLLHRVIANHHQISEAEFPEVEIREVWRDTLQRLTDQKAISSDSEIEVEQLAIEYEMRVNPVWSMPAAADSLAAIQRAGLALGIVSNAQFFTPLLFPALLGKTLPAYGFDEALQFWSFEHQQAKPGTFLYEQAAAALQTLGIASDEALYVGNDMRNDIAPAARVGFRTVLFAGDQRSLRLRVGDPMVQTVVPDRIVTDLRQIPEMLGLG